MQQSKPVQSPLTLMMTIKSEEAYEQLHALLTQIQSMPEDQNPISVALTKIGIVHFARFTFLENNTKLGVFTTYDGDLDSYLHDFANEIGPLLDQVFEFIQDAPPAPISEHREEFFKYVKDNDKFVLQWYSAYPNLTVLDIKALEASQG